MWLSFQRLLNVDAQAHIQYFHTKITKQHSRAHIYTYRYTKPKSIYISAHTFMMHSHTIHTYTHAHTHANMSNSAAHSLSWVGQKAQCDHWHTNSVIIHKLSLSFTILSDQHRTRKANWRRVPVEEASVMWLTIQLKRYEPKSKLEYETQHYFCITDEKQKKINKKVSIWFFFQHCIKQNLLYWNIYISKLLIYKTSRFSSLPYVSWTAGSASCYHCCCNSSVIKIFF